MDGLRAADEDPRPPARRGGSAPLYGAGAGLLAAAAALLQRPPSPGRRPGPAAALGAVAGLALIGAGARRAGRVPGGRRRRSPLRRSSS